MGNLFGDEFQRDKCSNDVSDSKWIESFVFLYYHSGFLGFRSIEAEGREDKRAANREKFLVSAAVSVTSQVSRFDLTVVGQIFRIHPSCLNPVL